MVALFIIAALSACRSSVDGANRAPGAALIRQILGNVVERRTLPMTIEQFRAHIDSVSREGRYEASDTAANAPSWTSPDGTCSLYFPPDANRHIGHFWAKCEYANEREARVALTEWHQAVGADADTSSVALAPFYRTTYIRLVDSVAVDESLARDDERWIAGIGLRNGVAPPP